MDREMFVHRIETDQEPCHLVVAAVVVVGKITERVKCSGQSDVLTEGRSD